MADLGYSDVRHAMHDALQEVRSDIGRLGNEVHTVIQQTSQHAHMISSVQHQMQQRTGLEQQVSVLKDYIVTLNAKVDQLNAQLQNLKSRRPES